MLEQKEGDVHIVQGKENLAISTELLLRLFQKLHQNGIQAKMTHLLKKLGNVAIKKSGGNAKTIQSMNGWQLFIVELQIMFLVHIVRGGY